MNIIKIAICLIVLAASFSLMLTSCTTYYISLESFKQQFVPMDTNHLKLVSTRGPGGDIVQYKTYDLDIIKCVDNKGNPAELKNSPSIEIRFINTNNRKTIFYFDLMLVNDSAVTGIQSRFIPLIRKTIPLNTVTKIEVQDGKKNFHYVY